MQYVSLRKAHRSNAGQSSRLEGSNPKHSGSDHFPAGLSLERMSSDLDCAEPIPREIGGQYMSPSRDPSNDHSHTLSSSDRSGDFYEQMHRLESDEHQPLSCLGPHSLSHQAEMQHSTGIHAATYLQPDVRRTACRASCCLFDKFHVCSESLQASQIVRPSAAAACSTTSRSQYPRSVLCELLQQEHNGQRLEAFHDDNEVANAGCNNAKRPSTTKRRHSVPAVNMNTLPCSKPWLPSGTIQTPGFELNSI
jgi:hypothetical protein